MAFGRIFPAFWAYRAGRSRRRKLAKLSGSQEIFDFDFFAILWQPHAPKYRISIIAVKKKHYKVCNLQHKICPQ